MARFVWFEAPPLRHLKNVLAGSRLITQQAFRQDFPALDSSLIYETACGLPEQWRVALRDRTAASWFDGCLPRDLFEETEDYKPQHLAVTRPNTLVSRPPPRLETLRVAEVYGTMMASAFTMPRVFDTHAGPAARHAHLFHGPTPEARAPDVGRAARRIKHPAVPPEITETAYSVALSALPFGPNKRALCGATASMLLQYVARRTSHL